ncbi:MAG: TRAP transporter small permease [Methylobacteriaceae bacterium]|nr:TRAP transporter small permease [Methylobacteriaceae bacterium]
MLDRLNAAVYYLLGALLAVIVIVVLLQVLVRFVLTSLGVNVAAPWTEEMARYVLVWLIFLGAAVGCRKMQLISLEFVVRGAPALLGKLARIAALALCLVLFLLMLRYGVEFVNVIGRSELSPVMQIPKTWVYWAMPVGASLMIVNTLAFVADAAVEGRDIREHGALSEEA